MACLSTNRFCARVVKDKLLCQFVLLPKENFYQQSSIQRKFITITQSAATATYNKSILGIINNKKSTTTSSSPSSSSSSSTSSSSSSAASHHTSAAKCCPIFINGNSTSRVQTPHQQQQQQHIQRNPKQQHQLLHLMNHGARRYSSVHTQQPAGPVREMEIDPYLLLDDDIKYVTQDIRDLIQSGTNQPELDTIAKYYFDGQGKALRPMVAMLMARAVNYHFHKDNREPLESQRQVAMISEMIHSASLIHDDVIDQSNFRRGKPSVNVLWNHRKVTMTGDYILSIASIMISRLKNDDVTLVLSQILTDLVQGEFMQLGAKESENERFNHYLTKTYRKTASLIANSLKSVAILGGADESISELAFQYGRNVGLAFQLVDDLLDFVSSAEAMGKPTAADLKLGLATAPVLFACEKFPELNPMIMRRFEEPGDVERAFELVHKSQGLEQTRFLARKHCIEAIRLAQELAESPYQKGLIVVNDFVLNRMK